MRKILTFFIVINTCAYPMSFCTQDLGNKRIETPNMNSNTFPTPQNNQRFDEQFYTSDGFNVFITRRTFSSKKNSTSLPTTPRNNENCNVILTAPSSFRDISESDKDNQACKGIFEKAWSLPSSPRGSDPALGKGANSSFFPSACKASSLPSSPRENLNISPAHVDRRESSSLSLLKGKPPDIVEYKRSQIPTILPSLIALEDSRNSIELDCRDLSTASLDGAAPVLQKKLGLLPCITVKVKTPPAGFDKPVLCRNFSEETIFDRNKNYKMMQLRYNLCQQLCGSDIFSYEEAAFYVDNVQQLLYLLMREYEEANFLKSEISGLIDNSHYSSRDELEYIYDLVCEYKDSIYKRRTLFFFPSVDTKEYKNLLGKTTGLAFEISRLINKQAIKYNIEKLGSTFSALKRDHDEMLATYNLPQEISKLNEITKDAKKLKGQRGLIFQALENKIERLLNKNSFTQAFINFASDLCLMKQILSKTIELSDSAELINKHSLSKAVSSYAKKAFEYSHFPELVKNICDCTKNISQLGQQYLAYSFFIENDFVLDHPKSVKNFRKSKELNLEIKKRLNFLSTCFFPNDLKKLLCVSEAQISSLNNWLLPSDKIEVLTMLKDWRVSIVSFNTDLKKFSYYSILEMLSISAFQLYELVNKIKSAINLQDMEIAFAVKIMTKENGKQESVKSIRTDALQNPKRIKVYLSRITLLLNSIFTLLPNVAPWLYEMNIIRPYHCDIIKKNLFCMISSQDILNKLRDLYRQQFNYLIKIKILTEASGDARGEIIDYVRETFQKESCREEELLADLQNVDGNDVFSKIGFFQNYRNTILSSIESFRWEKIKFCEYLEIISKITEKREDLLEIA